MKIQNILLENHNAAAAGISFISLSLKSFCPRSEVATRYEPSPISFHSVLLISDPTHFRSYSFQLSFLSVLAHMLNQNFALLSKFFRLIECAANIFPKLSCFPKLLIKIKILLFFFLFFLAARVTNI